MEQTPGAGVSFGAVEPPPCKQPLEVLNRAGEWVVREYYRTSEAVSDAITTFGTYDTHIDAMREGQKTMKARRHPCLLRWDTDESVGGLYWNPVFEGLSVEYSPLLRSWVVTPKDGHFVFQTAASTDGAYQLGKLVLEQYDFKRVEFYTKDGECVTERDHRFIRHDITKSGVRFKRGRLPESVEQPLILQDDSQADETTAAESEAQDDTSTAVITALASVVPDITQLEPIDTEGSIHTYQTPWDDQTARIWVLNPEYDDHRTLIHTFGNVVTDWESLTTQEGITPIIERGSDPATWVIYDASDTPLVECYTELTTSERLQVLSQLETAITAAHRDEIYRIGLSPDRVRIDTTGTATETRTSTRTRTTQTGYTDPRQTETADGMSAHVAGLGLHRRVSVALDQYNANRYMAPEQLQQKVTPTTPVYQLGAFAYWLCTETEPFHDRQDFTTALVDGDIIPPQQVADIPADAGDCIQKAMDTDPLSRYSTPAEFVQHLKRAFE